VYWIIFRNILPEKYSLIEVFWGAPSPNPRHRNEWNP
jgi:hypothetical protein